MNYYHRIVQNLLGGEDSCEANWSGTISMAPNPNVFFDCPHTNPKALSAFAFLRTCSSCSDLLAVEARFFCHMPGSNLTGRFETRMWYITEKVEPSRTKDIGGKFAVKKKNRTCRRVGPGERVITISPVPRLVFCSRSHFSSGRGRSESGLSTSGLVPSRLRRTGKKRVI